MKFAAILVAAVATVSATRLETRVAIQTAELEMLKEKINDQEQELAKMKSIFDTIKGFLWASSNPCSEIDCKLMVFGPSGV